jgi:hypothetical protein
MSKPKPAQPEIIKALMGRVDMLLKLGVITKDFVINSEEAAALTGLSVETLRRYARFEHISCIAYPGRNLYPLKELCEFVEKHYRKATIANTSQMNGYTGVKMGRPKKGKTI